MLRTPEHLLKLSCFGFVLVTDCYAVRLSDVNRVETYCQAVSATALAVRLTSSVNMISSSHNNAFTPDSVERPR